MDKKSFAIAIQCFITDHSITTAGAIMAITIDDTDCYISTLSFLKGIPIFMGLNIGRNI